MLINLYKNQTPLALFTLPILVIILCLPLLFTPHASYQYTYDWLSQLYADLEKNNPLLYILTVAGTIGNALLLNLAFNRNDFYSKNSYLPGLFYVLALFSLDLLFFSPNLLAHTFIILSLGRLLGLNRQNDAKDLIFKSSFSIGIAIFLNPALFPLGLLPWFGLIVFRPFIWREYILTLLGITLPTLFHFTIYYSIHGDFAMHLQGMALVTPVNSYSIYDLISYGIFVLIFLYVIWKYAVVMGTQIVRFKKLSRIIFHLFWLSVVSYALEWYFFDQIIFTVAIPFAIIAGLAVLHIRQTGFINLVVVAWFISSALKVFL